MATKTFTTDRDSSIYEPNLGNTVDQHHPVGLHQSSGNIFRAFERFVLDFSDVASISSAILHLRATTQVHIAFGSGPTLRVKRLTSALNNTQGGSAEGLWSSSANPAWDVPPNSTTTGQSAATNMTRTESAWDTIDVTDIMVAWLGGAANYGIQIRAESEASNADAWEFYSRESSSDPYITITYTTIPTNVGPSTPSGASPTGGVVIAGTVPTIAFDHVDADGDALISYDLQVSTDPSFVSVTHYDAGSLTGGIAGNHVSIAYSSLLGAVALSRGVTYWWRARTYSATGITTASPWTGANQFRPNSLPVAALTQPSASGRLAKLTYVAGSGWVTPRLEVSWSYSDADGHVQGYYWLQVVTDSGGAPSGATIYDAQVASGVSTVSVPVNLTENTRYHIRVTVWDGMEWGPWSAYFITRVRWGLSTHRKDVSVSGAAPNNWNVSALHTTVDASKQAVVIEYNSTTDGTTGLAATWLADLSSVVKRKWVHYRAWFLYWGASPGTSGSLDDISFSVSGNVIQPDNWLPLPLSGVGGSIELSDRVFGTQSLRIDGNGGWRGVYQVVPIEPNTNYVLQARIKSVGNSGAHVYVNMGGVDQGFVLPAGSSESHDWTQKTSAPFNSGSQTSLTVYCSVSGAAGTVAFFDGLKLEHGVVASPWTAATLAARGVLDAAGVQIDANEGGVVRLLGSAGGVRDRVDLGTKGLLFGGDAEVLSKTAGELWLPPVSGLGGYSLRAQSNVTGGGTCSFWASGSFGASVRFIVITQGLDPAIAAAGYFDIGIPVSGTVTGVGGHADVTATGAGVPMGAWDALYYILPLGGGNTNVPANFRIATYNGALVIPSHWVLVALRNSDSDILYVCNGLRLQLGSSGAEGDMARAGDMKPWHQSGALPPGWYWADGVSLLRTDYPALFTAIGVAYGAADGTHFSLPNARGRALYGRDGGAVATSVGSAFGGFNHAHGGTTGIFDPGASNATAGGLLRSPAHSHTISGDNPPGLTIEWIIKL